MNFSSFMSNLTADAEKMLGRIKDKDTFKRVVYSAFLIASADGSFDAAEKSALAKLINKDLPQFGIKDVIALIAKAEDLVAFDKTVGELEIMAEIGKARGDSAELIIRTAIFIGNSDGTFDADEKSIARKIANKLGLSPSDYGL